MMKPIGAAGIPMLPNSPGQSHLICYMFIRTGPACCLTSLLVFGVAEFQIILHQVFMSRHYIGHVGPLVRR